MAPSGVGRTDAIGERGSRGSGCCLQVPANGCTLSVAPLSVGWPRCQLPVASCLLAVGSWQLAATKAYYSARNKHKVGAICNINLKG